MHIERIGHEVNWSPSQKLVGLPYGNTTFLLKDIVMQDGLLFAYSAYFLSNQPIRFELTQRHFSTDFDKVIDFGASVWGCREPGERVSKQPGSREQGGKKSGEQGAEEVI